MSKARCACPAGVVQWIRHEKTGAKLNVATSDRRRALKRSQNGNGIMDKSTLVDGRCVAESASTAGRAERAENLKPTTAHSTRFP